MKKEILILGIIFLFIGLGINPAFAVEISNDTTSEDIEDCDCEVTDNFDIVRIKSLLNRAERSINRVETFAKLIPILSKDNPEVFEVCLEYIDECQEKLETIRLNIQSGAFELICSLIEDFKDFLINLIYGFVDMLAKIAERFTKFYPIYCIIGQLIIDILDFIVEMIYITGYFLDCDWFDPFPM